MSDEDDLPAMNHWSELTNSVSHLSSPAFLHSEPPTTKRPADDSNDAATEDCHRPVFKSARSAPTDGDESAALPSLPPPVASSSAASRTFTNLPAFASRETYVKLPSLATLPLTRSPDDCQRLLKPSTSSAIWPRLRWMPSSLSLSTSHGSKLTSSPAASHPYELVRETTQVEQLQTYPLLC